MKQKLLGLIALYIPLLLFSQTDTSYKGIKWTEDLTWQQVKENARMQHKYIFLDCFSTWCLPCKAMDKDVYPNSVIGRLMNSKFICVKMQMDKTTYDNEQVKKLYNDAQNIQQDYTVTAYPTFLLFSPDGEPIHKGIGYKNPEQFTEFVKDAFDPNKQYYRILSNFRPGKMDTAEMKGLARSFRFSDAVLSGKIAADYLNRIPKTSLKRNDNLNFMSEFNGDPQVQQIATEYLRRLHSKDVSSRNNVELIKAFRNVPDIQKFVLHYTGQLDNAALAKPSNLDLLSVFNNEPTAKRIADRYINSLPDKAIFTAKNIQFMGNFIKSSKDKGFLIFYHYHAKVDSVIKGQGHSKNTYVISNYAETIVEYIIEHEEIDSSLEEARRAKKDNVDWNKIAETISQKYNSPVASKVILDSKVRLYEYFAKKYNKNWDMYIAYNLQKIAEYGTDTTSGFIDQVQLNNFVWDAIFMHCNEKKQLNAGIKILEGVVRRNPDNYGEIDTYANLLYKVGELQMALQWEKKALEKAAEKKDEYGVKLFSDIINKMKNGEPTWPTSDVKEDQ